MLAAVTALTLLLAACAGGADDDAAPEPSPTDSPADPEPAPDVLEPAEDDAPADDEPDEPEPDPEPSGPPVDPAEVGADELGFVPVLMYHQLREDGGSDYDMTPEQFRAELTWLFDAGFRPVTTTQLVRGEIDIPAGTTPVVLTFDDSTASQARLTEDGELDPETSLGILVELASRYDDVEPRASVYVITSSLFGGTEAGREVLAVLHEHGMELGNHTHTHPSLRSLTDVEVQEELATNVAVVTDVVPGAEVVTLSLPLGIFPEDRALAASGSAAAGDYRHEGILLVGSNPAPSPFHADFEPLAIPRIRSDVDPEVEYASAWWFDIIEGSERWSLYVSDGDPTTISFPAARADELAPAFADRANPY